MAEWVDTTISKGTNRVLEDIKDRIKYHKEKGKDVSKYQKKTSKISKDQIIKVAAEKLEKDGVLDD